jgi:hypothetical protein
MILMKEVRRMEQGWATEMLEVIQVGATSDGYAVVVDHGRTCLRAPAAPADLIGLLHLADNREEILAP